VLATFSSGGGQFGRLVSVDSIMHAPLAPANDDCVVQLLPGTALIRAKLFQLNAFNAVRHQLCSPSSLEHLLSASALSNSSSLATNNREISHVTRCRHGRYRLAFGADWLTSTVASSNQLRPYSPPYMAQTSHSLSLHYLSNARTHKF